MPGLRGTAFAARVFFGVIAVLIGMAFLIRFAFWLYPVPVHEPTRHPLARPDFPGALILSGPLVALVYFGTYALSLWRASAASAYSDRRELWWSLFPVLGLAWIAAARFLMQALCACRL